MAWEPAHPDHAIERVTVTFQFAQPVSSKPWQALLNDATGRISALGFTAVEEVEFSPAAQGPGVAQFVFGPGGVISMQGGGGVSGRGFQRADAGRLVEEVSLHRSRVAYMATRYPGWEHFKARILELVSPPLDRMLPLENVAILKLEYWDRWVYDGPSSEADITELLNTASRHLPGFPMELRTPGLWHSHVGYFADPGVAERRLLNLNVDALDVAPGAPEQGPGLRRSIGIYSMAQDNISPAASPASADEVMVELGGMHEVLKLVLADVITPATAERISLNPQAPQ